MKRAALYIALSMVLAGLSVMPLSPAEAQEFLTLSSGNNVTVQGTVADVGSETFILKTAMGDFHVSTTRMDLDTSLRNLLAVGSTVYVAGDLETNSDAPPTLKASRVSVVGNAAGAPNIVVLDNNNND